MLNRWNFLKTGFYEGIKLVEQTTGVPRVSDLVLFWTVAAVLSAFPRIIDAGEAPAAPRKPVSRPPPTRSRRHPSVGGLAWRWGIALAVVIAGGALSWHKNVNYAWAALYASASIRAHQAGDLATGLERMSKAMAIAPDVEFYYIAKAEMMRLLTPMSSAERLEIATTRYETNRRALSINPLSFTAKLATASAAVELAKLGDEAKGVEAVRILTELVAAFPGYEKVYNDLGACLRIDQLTVLIGQDSPVATDPAWCGWTYPGRVSKTPLPMAWHDSLLFPVAPLPLTLPDIPAPKRNSFSRLWPAQMSSHSRFTFARSIRRA